MSFNNLPPIEGTSECEGNEDECSDSSDSLKNEGHLSHEKDELGFTNSQSFKEKEFPSGHDCAKFLWFPISRCPWGKNQNTRRVS